MQNTNKYDLSHNPQNKSTKELLQYKNTQKHLQILKNRVSMLQNHQIKQLKSFQKNKLKIEQIISNKINNFRIKEHKRKNTQMLHQNTLNQKRKNIQQRINHQRQMQTIIKAISLVKQQDAKQIRSASQKYLKTINQLKQQSLFSMKQRHKNIEINKEKAKINYLQQIKDKSLKQIEQRKKQIQELRRKKQQRLRQMQLLQQKEQKILSSISSLHSKSSQNKYKYFAALKLSPFKIAQNLDFSNINWQNQSQSENSLQKNNIIWLKCNKNVDKTKQIFPKTHINQEKLKLAMQIIKQRESKRNNQKIQKFFLTSQSRV